VRLQLLQPLGSGVLEPRRQLAGEQRVDRDAVEVRLGDERDRLASISAAACCRSVSWFQIILAITSVRTLSRLL
jgi:hypothetical protein